jgi:hypothetical protein
MATRVASAVLAANKFCEGVDSEEVVQPPFAALRKPQYRTRTPRQAFNVNILAAVFSVRLVIDEVDAHSVLVICRPGLVHENVEPFAGLVPFPTAPKYLQAFHSRLHLRARAFCVRLSTVVDIH